ncbi:hypothetical protein RV09_GL000759 [Enterococcus moraviensis]|nr:hypothetical protein RV09_GL000759 [Enterococcus moraviensis]
MIQFVIRKRERKDIFQFLIFGFLLNKDKSTIILSLFFFYV